MAFLAGWTGLERDQVPSIATALPNHRVLASSDTPSTGANTPLNATHLDRDLDTSQPVQRAPDPVEEALAKAIQNATAAGRFDIVALLAGELQGRRLARERGPPFRRKRVRGARRRSRSRWRPSRGEVAGAVGTNARG
jgi:hypothetical protein